MGKWLDLLAAQPAAKNAAPPLPLTVKTAQGGRTGLLTVRTGLLTVRTGLLTVLAVP